MRVQRCRVRHSLKFQSFGFLPLSIHVYLRLFSSSLRVSAAVPLCLRIYSLSRTHTTWARSSDHHKFWVDRLEQDVERLLVMKGTDPAVRKKAALCLLRFFRENPGNIIHSELSDKMVTAVCSDRDHDVGFADNCDLGC